MSEMEENINIDAGNCASSEPFALRVLGDSMEPEFEDGCIVIIDPSGIPKNGSYVIAQHEGNYIFRRLAIIGTEKYSLVPLNTGYENVTLDNLGLISGVVIQKSDARRRNKNKHYM
jgi:SOS-response transcriptional repressor LexA